MRTVLNILLGLLTIVACVGLGMFAGCQVAPLFRPNLTGDDGLGVVIGWGLVGGVVGLAVGIAVAVWQAVKRSRRENS